jgi:hypothetical protein
MAPHIDVNVIIVGIDKISFAKIRQLDRSLVIMKAILEARGPQIGTFTRFPVSTARVGALSLIGSRAQAAQLTQMIRVRNDGVDLFVVELISTWPPAAGFSAVNGLCDKDKPNGVRSPVVSLNGDADFSGNTFAHEMGHYLGLSHCEDRPEQCAGDAANFMKERSNGNFSTTTAQADIMKRHCAVKP